MKVHRPLHVDAVQALGCRVEQPLQRFLRAAASASSRPATCALWRTKPRPENVSSSADRPLSAEQQRLRRARGLAELGREALSSCVSRWFRIGACRRMSLTAALQCRRRGCCSRARSTSVRICWMTSVALGPGRDGRRHERHVLEPAEHPHQAVDVVRVVAALEEAWRACGRSGCGSSAAPRAPRGRRAAPPARAEALVVALAAALGVVEQVDLRVLLALRVQAFAGHVGAHGRHHFYAQGRHQHLEHDDAHKDGHHRRRPARSARRWFTHAPREVRQGSCQACG